MAASRAGWYERLFWPPFQQNGAMDDDWEVVRRLLDAIDQYGPYYDEVFWEVSARIRERGEAGKLDLAALKTS